MSGIELRVNKLFNQKRNLVISALDHVMEYGYQQGIEDEEKAIRNCLATDALLVPRYMLKRHSDLFALPGAPMPVVRINWTSSFYYPLDYQGGFTTIATTIEEAVEAGAEMAICSLFLENKNEEMETENVRIFSEVARQKERLGIPLIGECYVVEHAELSTDELHEKVLRVTGAMEQLGADLIKCFYTGDRFAEITENLSIPAFTIGAEKLKNDLDVLKKADDSVRRGARGIIFGRNIFMAEDPQKITDALNDVINNGVSPEDAAAKYDLK